MLNGTAQYALRAVLRIAEAGDEAVRVDQIAEALDVPRNYLSKTLHRLATLGVLTSERGPRGGFRLAVPPSELTIQAVIAPFDDAVQRRCLLGRSSCSWNKPCSAHPRWEAISLAAQHFFHETSIADLLAEIAERPAMSPRRDRAAPARTQAAARRKRRAGRTSRSP